MIYNYHTHTKRCNHATGEDREYVEAAIKAGVKTLGFSDHAPYVFPKELGYYSSFRMKREEGEEYVSSIRALAKEYASDIRILCGFEMEYYPDFHADQMQFIKQFSPDYLILGQHSLGNEVPIVPTQGGGDLGYYVTQTLAGLSTGDFLYLAHPDLPGYKFPEAHYLKEYRRLCEGAKALNIPLEINLLGIRTGRQYPSRIFFEIAAEVGNDIVIGVDAHDPLQFLDKSPNEKAAEMVKDLGLKLIEKPLL